MAEHEKKAEFPIIFKIILFEAFETSRLNERIFYDKK